MPDELRANIVRVGMRTFVVPDGQHLDGEIVIGPAPAELVYDVFYAETHHRCGHRRRDCYPFRCQYRCLGYRPRNYPPEWTWGAPT